MRLWVRVTHKKGGDDMSNIKKLRESLKLTQQDLADTLKIDRATISKWESGEFMPRAEKLPALAKALECTIDELLENQAV